MSLIPGLDIATGGGGLDFGANTGGDARGGAISIDARTTTGGGDPELLSGATPIVLIIAAAVVAYMVLRRK